MPSSSTNKGFSVVDPAIKFPKMLVPRANGLGRNPVPFGYGTLSLPYQDVSFFFSPLFHRLFDSHLPHLLKELYIRCS